MKIRCFVFVGLLIGSSCIHAAGIDDVLARKRKADITFAELMQIMHQATGMIFDGILYENRELLRTGTSLLENHPAPAKGPGVAIIPERREAFKNVMPTYDELFHGAVDRIEAAAEKGNWQEAYAGYREITDACVTCHAAWRPFAASRQPRP